jgi:ComEC/Rec2-related protein
MQPGCTVALRGAVSREPEVRDRGRCEISVRADAIRSGAGPWRAVKPATVLVSATARSEDGRARLARLMDPRAYGYRVEVRSVYAPAAAPLNPGEFDPREILAQKAIPARFACGADAITVLDARFGHPVVELALAAKRRFLQTYKTTIRAPASRLLAAASLGTRTAVAGQTYGGTGISELFRHAGVGHVLAVSGLHVSIVSLLLYALLRLTGLQPRRFAPILIVCLALFTILTGARPSSVRAAIMNTVILVAFAYFRYDLRRATIVGLALSSLFLLLLNPLTLFYSGFLLSFGAVLSLVALAPMLDRWIRAPRGFALLFAALWFAALIALASTRMDVLLRRETLLGLGGVLWLGVWAGGRLNTRVPSAWSVGLDRVPAMVRLLISAQLAIQLGMMIPLSAWFFGRFPVAGIFVNLLAIPLIGVVVQLGILTGLLGLIPWLGVMLALPVGVAATFAGEAFFLLARAGAAVFPFPAVPKPSVRWMVVYYLVLLVLVLGDAWRIRLQGVLYRNWRRRWVRIAWTRGGVALGLMLCLAPVAGTRWGAPRCRRILCLAAGPYPQVLFISTRRDVVALNAGDGYRGGLILFDAVRAQGAAALRRVILAGPDPRVGMRALYTLLVRMPVHACALPVTAARPEAYLDALGDAYIRKQAEDGTRWARGYATAYRRLTDALAERGLTPRTIEPGTQCAWRGLDLRALPWPDPLPTRYVARAKTYLFEAEQEGFRWLIVTDAAAWHLEQRLAGRGPYAVVVVPDLGRLPAYEEMLNALIACARPRVVMRAGGAPDTEFDWAAWAAEHGTFASIELGRDGAVAAEIDNAGALVLTTHVSGRTIRLRPEKRDTDEL